MAAMMKKPSDRPWEKIGISRSTWYRHGKPTEKPRKPMTVAEVAKQSGASSTRTYYRTLRVMGSELASFVQSGQLSIAKADRMLGDPTRLRRFQKLIAALQRAHAHAQRSKRFARPASVTIPLQRPAERDRAPNPVQRPTPERKR
jgi:hypothetical protein